VFIRFLISLRNFGISYNLIANIMPSESPVIVTACLSNKPKYPNYPKKYP
jgi:hypothetical protein